MTKLQTHDVFGLSNKILVNSYVDRGNLDIEVQKYLARPTHLALRGESKCGKSWFRQKNIPNGLIVQCRYGKSVIDIYTDALSQLGIKLIVDESSGSKLKGKIEAETSFGASLLAKIGFKATLEGEMSQDQKEKNYGHDINDLRYIAEIIIKSEKKLVIEDFHYLSILERELFSYDLKTLWDYGCFTVIIGVWSQSNLLTYLNQDLSGRIIELSIYWSQTDLVSVIQKGSLALNIKISSIIQEKLIEICYGNVGILQQLLLAFLDEMSIFTKQDGLLNLESIDIFETAAMKYAEQLNPLYQQFARTVSSGIRKREDSTGIYAHAMAVIVESSDNKLINGLNLDEIYRKSRERQPRIQKINMRTILTKLEELQVDKDGRGLVITFNEANDDITAVDRQFLFYRRFLTVRWPWEDLIAEAEAAKNDPNQMKLF
ncbi:hypothetical protein [Cohnella thailandensis]|uniref:Uncharacterized protein n=1 Tax=Cohnella thailandensis TaxID=557557 RepID=A0A841T095_9BACL|nr:hypothetical protein [Cohnella thailandensis]MBB6635297.1 hypothetical protein [Cohnella thailandensis]MBP1974675.1 hypothetical protein [Cohnella thailandensis]